MGLVAGGRGGAEEKKEEEEKKKEKIPHMCESIGHRPLRGRCPKKAECTATQVMCRWAGTVIIVAKALHSQQCMMPLS